MKNHREEINQQFAYKLIALQITVTIIASALAGLLSETAIYAALIGGFIGVIGNIWFARGVFKASDTKSAKDVLLVFYVSEISKLVIVFILFFIAFKRVDALQDPQNALIMFMTFAATLCVNIIAPLLIRQNNKISSTSTIKG